MVLKREVQVFVSCPSDVEREKKIVEDICKNLTAAAENHCDISFRTKDWSTVAGSFGSRPQEEINSQIGEYDIYIGIWDKRFGSKTGAVNPATQVEFESGTHEEFSIAEQRYKDHKTPKIFLFFRKFGITETVDLDKVSAEVEQARKIEAFRKGIMEQNWVYIYDDHLDFSLQAHKVLQKFMLDFCWTIRSDERDSAVQVSNVDLELLRRQYPAPVQPYISRLYSKSNLGSNSSALGCLAPEPIDLLHLVTTEHRIVVLGDAGSGKSMELANLANRFSQEKAPFLGVYKRLNLYSPQIGLAEFLGEEWSKMPQELLVVLLDGLDEIKPLHFDDVVNQILFFAEKNPEVGMIVSCRTNFFVSPEGGAGGTLPGFVPFYLVPFGREDIARFYRESFPSDNPESFLQALADANLGDLVARPYFLMELARLYHQRGDLNVSRAELLGLFMDTRIRMDRIHFEGVVDIKARKKMFRELIERIALSISILGTNIIGEDELLELVSVEEFEQLPYCAALKREETDSQVWRFEHNNLQEYLAASALSKLPFEKLLHLITFEPDYEKIIPTWINTLTFLYAILDAGSPLLSSLTDWLVRFEPDVIIKMEADKIDPATRMTLFRTIYGEFEKKGHLVRSNTFSTRELAKFGESEETIDYLVDQLSRPGTLKVNKVNALNLLGFFDYSNTAIGGTVSDAIITLARDNREDEELVHNAIYALWWGRLNDGKVVSDVLAIVGSNESSYVRSSVYALLSNFSGIDAYVDYILEGVGILRSRAKNPTEMRVADESWHLQHCVIGIRGTEALLKVIGYFKADRFSEYGFESDEMLDGIISNAINLASKAPEVYSLMVSWWKEQVNYFSQGKAGKILRFFDKTGTRERLFIEIWQKATADLSQKFLYLSELATPASISYLVKEYNDRNVTKNDLGNFYHQLNWVRSPLTEVFEREAREKGGYIVEKPVTRDFKAEIAARRTRDFAVLFDKEAWMAAVNEIFDKEGKEEIAFGGLFEIRREKNISKDLEDIYSGSALRLMRDFCKPQKSVKRDEVIDWFDEEQYFERYRIEVIFEHLRNNKDLVLSIEQKEWLTDWCVRTAPTVDWKTSIKRNQSGGATLNTFAMIVVYLVKLLQIVLPEAIMLDMLYFDYRDENTGGVLNYVETKVPEREVALRVVENLKDGIEVDPVLQNYVNYAAARQLTDAYPYIRREIVNQLRADYFRSSILDSYYKGTHDNAGLFELLLLGDKAIRELILDYLIDTDLRPKVGNYVLTEFGRETDEKERSKLAGYLIRMKYREGIDYLISHVKDETYAEHPFERPGTLNHLNSIDMLPALLEILELGCLDRGHLNRYESLVSAALHSIYNLGISSDENFRVVMTSLEQWLSEKGDTFPGVDTVKDCRKRIIAQYYMNKARTATIDDVKRKLEKLKG